jgi:hypothetical protein
MKTKLIIFLILGLLCTALLPSITADSDPQIIDEIGDVKENILAQLLFPDKIVNTIDVMEAWFYEESTEPDFLFIGMKISGLGPKYFHQIYTVKWEYNDILYFASYHSMYFGNYQVANGGKYATLNMNLESVECEYTIAGAIINIKVPKEAIGDPQPGEILTNTYSWNALRFGPISFYNICIDHAGYLGEQYGLDYTINF